MYIGKCRTKGCKHATRVNADQVQELDSDRKTEIDGKLVYTLADGTPYDNTRAHILNGVAVAMRCPDHGVYKLNYLKGRLVEDKKCDGRCMGATGPSCDCSCGGANHGINHG